MRHSSLRNTVSFICLLLFLITQGRAEDTLDFPEIARAITIANPELQRARLSTAIAESRLQGTAYFPSLPEIEVSHRNDALTNGDGLSMNELTVSQEFEIAGQYSLRRSIAERGVHRYQAEARALENALINDAAQTYARLAVRQRQIGLLRELSASAMYMREFMEKSFEVGRVSAFESSLASIDAAASVADLHRAESDLIETQSRLSLLLARDTAFQVYADIDTDILSPAASLDSLQKVALRNRPELQAAEAGLSTAEFNLALAGRSYIPNIRVGGLFASDNSIFPGEKTSYFLGLNVSAALPLPVPGVYDYGRARVLEATVERDIAALELSLLRRRIENDILVSSARYQGAKRSLEAFSRVYPDFQRNLEEINKAHRIGQIDLTTYLAQKERIARSQQAYFDVLEEFLVAQAQLYYVLGILLQ